MGRTGEARAAGGLLVPMCLRRPSEESTPPEPGTAHLRASSYSVPSTCTTQEVLKTGPAAAHLCLCSMAGGKGSDTKTVTQVRRVHQTGATHTFGTQNQASLACRTGSAEASCVSGWDFFFKLD